MIGIITAATIYAATMKVTAVIPVSNTVVMETATGHIYEMHGTDDWLKGDLVSLVMDGKGTEDVTDDEILSATYAGWWIEDGYAYAVDTE